MVKYRFRHLKLSTGEQDGDTINSGATTVTSSHGKDAKSFLAVTQPGLSRSVRFEIRVRSNLRLCLSARTTHGSAHIVLRNKRCAWRTQQTRHISSRSTLKLLDSAEKGLSNHSGGSKLRLSQNVLVGGMSERLSRFPNSSMNAAPPNKGF